MCTWQPQPAEAQEAVSVFSDSPQIRGGSPCVWQYRPLTVPLLGGREDGPQAPGRHGMASCMMAVQRHSCTLAPAADPPTVSAVSWIEGVASKPAGAHSQLLGLF